MESLMKAAEKLMKPKNLVIIIILVTFTFAITTYIDISEPAIYNYKKYTMIDARSSIAIIIPSEKIALPKNARDITLSFDLWTYYNSFRIQMMYMQGQVKEVLLNKVVKSHETIKLYMENVTQIPKYNITIIVENLNQYAAPISYNLEIGYTQIHSWSEPSNLLLLIFMIILILGMSDITMDLILRKRGLLKRPTLKQSTILNTFSYVFGITMISTLAIVFMFLLGILVFRFNAKPSPEYIHLRQAAFAIFLSMIVLLAAYASLTYSVLSGLKSYYWELLRELRQKEHQERNKYSP